MKIARHCLRVTDASELAAFYGRYLGMRNFGTQEVPLLGYDPTQCLLELRGAARQPYNSGRNDFYWKIGITLCDLDHAVDFLRQQGWPVSDPRQFGDIGYLCHLSDPQGFSIELLQQGFEGHKSPAGEGHPIGEQSTFAHITLRVNDISAARSFCEQDLGMRLMSVQPVTEYGFCLYFYCGSDENLPNPDLESVGNREWLWKRPYALLELQHVFSGQVNQPVLDDDHAGFGGFGIRTKPDAELTYIQPARLARFSSQK
jgi:catechol 2,3-dioxygenase-like lactoylglutathione lyase family enzyme